MIFRYFKSSLFGRVAAALLITGTLAAGDTAARPNQPLAAPDAAYLTPASCSTK